MTPTDSGVHKLYRRDNQPFAQIPNEAIRDPRLSHTGFRLLAYLMSHNDGYELTYQQIERETGMGRWSINEAAKNLTALGWLEAKQTVMPDGRFGAKAWILLSPAVAGFSAAVDSVAAKPTDKEDNFLKNKTKENIHAQHVERLFDLFWEAYPRKVGKLAAKKAFEKAVTQIDGQAIVTAAWKFQNDPYLPLPQFIPHPTTWLNEGRWEDGPLPVRELTPDERAAKAKAKAQRDHEMAMREAEERRLEAERLEAELRANPPQMCEHDRIKHVCRKCRQG
jgi:hypothetical protein